MIHFKFVGIKDMHNIYYLGLSGERSLPFGLLVFVVSERKYFIIVSVTINLCQRKIARPNAPLLDGKTSFSSFRIITAKFSSVPKFRNFTVSFFFSGLCNKRT